MTKNMKIFMETLEGQMETIIDGFFKHFKDFPISIIFLIFLFLVLILNIVKSILIGMEKKHGLSYATCQYLFLRNREQDCTHPDHREYFIKNGKDCEGCRGKTFNMSDAEAEQRIKKGSLWKCIIILSASFGKDILPYISFIYTLVITILNSK